MISFLFFSQLSNFTTNFPTLFSIKNSKLEKQVETSTTAIFDALWLPTLYNSKLYFLVCPVGPKIELFEYVPSEKQGRQKKNIHEKKEENMEHLFINS